MIRPDQDPEIKIQLEESKHFFREHGRLPKDGELDTWKRKKHEQVLLAEQQENERRSRELAEREEQRRVREDLLASRKVSRIQRPPGYLPPTDLAQLKGLLEEGQSFFEGCQLSGEENKELIIDLDLECVNLSNSEFRFVRFSKVANLSRANFSGSMLHHITFESGCRLVETDFSSTEIDDLFVQEGAKVEGASFQFAKFKGAASMVFDRNYLANATFYKRRADEWFSLSSSYAGIWQFIHIALSAIYFGMILFKIYLFDAIAKTQEMVVEFTASAFAATSLRIDNDAGGTITAWSFIFGDRISSILTVALLLIYQALRLYMTLKVSPLIESERQTGYTPDKADYVSLGLRHNLLRMLGFTVIIIFSYELYEIFRLEVDVPYIISINNAENVSVK